jgi:hypothetical protein
VNRILELKKSLYRELLSIPHTDISDEDADLMLRLAQDSQIQDLLGQAIKEERQRLDREKPLCGNDGSKWCRDNCEYDESNRCIHCGEGIPY